MNNKFRAWFIKEERMTPPFDVWNMTTALQKSIFTGDALPLEYTGMIDKNGEEIYEGDILAYQDAKAIVKSSLGGFSVKWKGEEGYQSGYLNDMLQVWANGYDKNGQPEKCKLSIIGNIYQKI